MSTSEPSVSDNGRYSIGEAASILGIHRNTLRAHTEQGLIKCGFRRQNMRRFYTGMELKKYWKSQY